ncbi:MAG: hypothetical protein HY000_05275 [Planctomycetes bacterium]|nr:hypothetical protein [Planctomycetota bacterium]
MIDFSYGTGGQFNRSPTRLVPEGDGVVYVFLQFAPPDLPPAQLEGIVMVVEEELALLKRQLED